MQDIQKQDMNELLLQSVQTLPSLPTTIEDLKTYIDTHSSNLQIDEVAQILSKDPLVTARLLQLANSPSYGFSREITTLNQIITLLGVSNIKNIIIADSLKNNFKVDVSPYGLDTQAFIKNCNEETQFISTWLLKEDKKLSHLLVPCAMLLRLGMIVFSNFLIQNHKDKEFLKLLQENKFKELTNVEYAILGVDHFSFLGFLFHRWDFDELLIESICFVNTPHSAPNEVKKNAYALAIADMIFAPYTGSSVFNMKRALALINEAKSFGIVFDENHFIASLPQKAKENLNASDEN